VGAALRRVSPSLEVTGAVPVTVTSARGLEYDWHRVILRLARESESDTGRWARPAGPGPSHSVTFEPRGRVIMIMITRN
jgi:hypothetical protein